MGPLRIAMIARIAESPGLGIDRVAKIAMILAA
jgi:hypothetical protein